MFPASRLTVPYPSFTRSGSQLDHIPDDGVQALDARAIVSQQILRHQNDRQIADTDPTRHFKPALESWMYPYVVGPYGNSLPPTVASVLPQHNEPSWLFDRILLDLVHSQRDLLRRGGSASEAVGPPSFQAAAFVHLAARELIDPVSRVITDVMVTFEEIQVPERLACAWLLHRVLQVRATTSLVILEATQSRALTDGCSGKYFRHYKAT
jgi:hypothetical protein